MKRIALLAVLSLVAVASASASSGQTLRGDGVTLSLPAGWHSFIGPGGVQAADFPLPRRARSSADLVRVPRGHVHLIVWNYGPWASYLPQFRPARAPLALTKRNLTGAVEGFGTGDTYALRTARLGGEMLEILADLGPKPLEPSALRKVNAVLATLRVLPPRVVRPRHERLAAEGVSVRLGRGWTGRMEIPAERYGARVVVRATRAGVHVELFELSGAPLGGHVELPVVLTRRSVVRRHSLAFARRVFSTGGRSFDLSVTARSARGVLQANRFLATLTVMPRPWTFRSCDLSLRLPGTWRAGIRPRGGCYPVLTLSGPGVRIVLTELRAGEQASGRLLRRSGRRFEVELRPASARARADAILATLRAKPRA